MKVNLLSLVLICLITSKSFCQDIHTVIGKYFQSVGGQEVIKSLQTVSKAYETYSFYPKLDTTYTEVRQRQSSNEITLIYKPNRSELRYQTVVSKDSLHIMWVVPFPNKVSSKANRVIDVDESSELLRLYKSRMLKYLKAANLKGIQTHVIETRYSDPKQVKTTYYFDVETGYLLAQKLNDNITFYKDYRIVNGLYYSFFREQFLGETLLNRTIFTNVEFNVNLTPADFKPRNFNTRSPRITDSEHNKITFVEAKFSNASFIDLVNHFQGERILIDVWASWCGPCKHEFLGYDNEFYAFLDSKNIKMLFVSIDTPEKENAWKKDLQWFNLNGYHIRADKKLSNSIQKELSGENPLSIPKYVLVNEGGDILSKDLGKPSSAKFRERIEYYLNQK